tara:strand:- start:3989 stop:5371 length:1383 start_codon:yes stop_codon:yes gene_type:complete
MENISINVSEFNSNDTPKINISESPSVINISTPTSSKSVNFGPDAEMFMNTKNISTPKSGIQTSDLNNLESINLDTNSSLKDTRKSLFSGLDELNSSSEKIKISDPLNTKFNDLNVGIKILPDASQKDKKFETSDGFKTFNDIPVNPSLNVPNKVSMSNEYLLREKIKILRKLEALERKGIQLSKKYTMDSSLDEMKGEFEMIKSEKEKKSSVKFQGKMLMAFISGIEFLNGKFDPLDIKLDGWSESVSENIDEYDEIFGELHEKYGSKAKMAPELKLLFMLGGSAAMVHMTNTMFKSAMPGMDDIMRQNPDLMQQFTQAAVNTMGTSNPGLGNFMNGVMGNTMPPQGSPPGPPENLRQKPPTFNSRPDLNSNINMRTPFDLDEDKNRNSRPEMKGPGDLRDILSGLKTKTKTININENKDESTISVEDLNAISSTKFKKPRKSKKKPKSERNTVTLNLN